MALKHVKRYMYQMQNQYLEMKADLADFEDAFKAGYITEDQLTEAKQDIQIIEANYQRLLYIMHLFEIPARPGKEKAFRDANKDLIEAFSRFNADQAAVMNENTSTLNHLRSELKKLSGKGGEKE